ncbi:unnamed protein product [Lampetra planeri]
MEATLCVPPARGGTAEARRVRVAARTLSANPEDDALPCACPAHLSVSLSLRSEGAAAPGMPLAPPCGEEAALRRPRRGQRLRAPSHPLRVSAALR